MTAEEKKRKKKKQSSVLEAELFRIMEKSLKAAMDKALDDIFSAYWTVGKSSETIENTRKNRGNAVKYLQRDSEVWKKKFAGDEDVSARRLWPA